MVAASKSTASYSWLIHVLCWLGFYAILVILRSESSEHADFTFLQRPSFIIFHLYILSLFYLNAYLLVPAVLYRFHVLVYILAVLLTIIVLGAIVYSTSRFSHAGHSHHNSWFFVGTVFPGIFICAVSTSFRIIQDRIRSEGRLKERENENLKTELSFLRSQVSPHFVFNVLNNIVSLARKKSDRVEGVVIQLSQLLRYMLYESDAEQVSLEKEIEYLRNYIDLQMLRFGDDVKITFELDNKFGNHAIEPMLLIPFVENAFKHGVVLIDKPEINIKLVTCEKGLDFYVRNKFKEGTGEVKDKNSGIGLNNVTRRLNLLYADSYKLDILKVVDVYNVHLKLTFK